MKLLETIIYIQILIVVLIIIMYLYVIFSILSVAIPNYGQEPTKDTNASPTPTVAPTVKVDIVEDTTDVLARINNYRHGMGKEPLKPHKCLRDSIQEKHKHMQRWDYWAHEGHGTKFSHFIYKHCPFQYAAENLSIDWSREDVVQAWKDSPPHNRLLLSPKIEWGAVIVDEIDINGEAHTVITFHAGA